MKKNVLVLLSILIIPSLSMAGTQYVKEVMTITLRRGPGTSQKIIDMLSSGEKLAVFEESAGWTHVKTKEGRDGWVLTRFLTTDEPLGPVLSTLKKKHASLQEAYDKTSMENTVLKEKNQRLQKELNEKNAAFESVNSAYEKLKNDSAEFISVRKRLTESQQLLEGFKRKNEELENVVIKLQNNQILKGIVIGAGILLIGIIIGLRFKRQRRQSSLLS